MRNNLTTALNGMALAALLVFSLSAHSAPAKRAVVYPSGRVWVDGKAVKTVTTLFPGDQIATARGATAAIVSQGSTTIIPSNSHFVFGEAATIKSEHAAAAEFFNSTRGPKKCPPGHGGNGHDCRPISPSRP